MRTQAEIAQDEQVLAKIIAGGEGSGRKVLPAVGERRDSSNRRIESRNGFGVQINDMRNGPCCAVGAGVLYAGTNVVHSALTSFAQLHGVTWDYAKGVSDGFENERTDRIENSDYLRGYAVGAAAFDYFGENGDGS